MRCSLILFCLWLFPFYASAASIFEEEIMACQREKSCFTSADGEEGDPSFFAFASFSLPQNLWIEMSKGLEH